MGPDPLIYCLERLTDYSQFERLCSDMMRTIGFRDLEPLGGSADGGRDAVMHCSKTGLNYIFAYSARKDWQAKLNEDAAKAVASARHCDVFVFVTNANFSTAERDAVLAKFAKNFEFELELYGSERVCSILRTDGSHLISAYPQIFHPEIVTRPVRDETSVKLFRLDLVLGTGIVLPREELIDFAAQLILAVQEEALLEFDLHLDRIDELKDHIDETKVSASDKAAFNAWIIAKTKRLNLISDALNGLIYSPFFESFQFKSNEFADVLAGLPVYSGLVEQFSTNDCVDVWMYANDILINAVVELDEDEWTTILKTKNLPSRRLFSGVGWDYYDLPMKSRNKKVIPAMMMSIADFRAKGGVASYTELLNPLLWQVGMH